MSREGATPPTPRLGVACIWHQLAYEELLTLARHAEELGYAALYVDGDVSQVPSLGERDVLDGWTVQTALTLGTRRIQIASIRLVHHWTAAHLAQAVATLERIAPGRQRLLASIGGQPADRAFGLPLAPVAERIGRLDETLACVRRLLRGEEVRFAGRHVQLAGARVRPVPVRPPPIEVAARRPRMLELVARRADAWNVNLPAIPGRVAAAAEVLARACARVGRAPSEIARSCWIFARPLAGAGDPEPLAAFRRFNPWFADLPDEEVRGALLVGGARGARARLEELRGELGLDLAVVEVTGLDLDAARHALDALAPAAPSD